MFPAGLAGSLLAWAATVAVALCAVVQLLIAAYAGHRCVILWRWWRSRRAARGAGGTGVSRADLPSVTVQVPVYNEPVVVARVIDAVAAFDYPPGRLEIQVLDDSDDRTAALAAAAVGRHAARGVAIHHLRRATRAGCKAGALAAGLARARGELIAVFDADFVPSADFLLRIVPRFADPAVGMVQARWGHLNRARSACTAAQAVLLDAHFLIEQPARMHAGVFFNFNGSAGVWRRACIEDAGGWSAATLTEDLDLSYRAQLRGWRFVIDERVAAPAELPGAIGALVSQQHRWTRGAIQTARRVLPRIVAAPLPWRVKLEAGLHLTGNLIYPLALLLGVLLLPVLLAAPERPDAALLAVPGVVLALLGPVPAWLCLGAARRLDGAGARAVGRDVPAAMLLALGLSWQHTRAVWEGLRPDPGPWVRTPKTGETDAAAGAGRGGAGRGGAPELALALGFTLIAAWAWHAGHAAIVPFTMLLAAGLGSVGVALLTAGRSSSTAVP